MKSINAYYQKRLRERKREYQWVHVAVIINLHEGTHPIQFCHYSDDGVNPARGV